MWCFASHIFNQGLEVLCFQKTILFFSIPFLLLSIYYQKFVEKKWCPICLIIISILITEIAVLSFLSNLEYNFVQQAITFGFVFTGSYLSWKGLKQLLTVKKELKENQLKSNRFEKNYDLFKTKLLSENNIVPPTNGVILGNQYAKTNITIVSNPFCGHCKEVHTILDKIVEKNKDNLNIKIILRTNLESLDEDSKKLFRGLLYLYYNQGSLAFSKSLKEWFDKRDIKDWLNAYYTENNFNEIDLILQNHLSWTNENEYTFTPAIFINGYEYPKMYDRKNLAYFISEIIEDTDFN